MRILRALAVGVSLLMASMPIGAQTVLGTVVLPDSTPAVGAIVVATSVSGATVGRALTGPRGDFVLRLSAPGRSTLRVLRIGFRPTDGPSVTVAEGATERVRIVFNSGAVMLADVRVRERETCRVGADTGLAVARVWEEARKAMLTSQLSVGDAPLFAEWIEYDRTLDSTSSIVRQQRVRTSRNPTTHAFKGVPAEVLRDQGFVVADSANTIYCVPDADALLSDAFVSGHCFRLLQSPTGDSSLVGVAFTPTRERREMREIEGTLWVNRATSELRTLEFRYVNLPEVTEPAHPGGLVEFQRLADGNWFISRWSVRMPQVGLRSRTSEGGMRRTIMAKSMAVLRAVQVAGGEVTRAVRGDSIVYGGTGPSILMQLVSSDSAASVGGATLALEGTDYADTSDTSGRFLLSPVLGGRYRATIRTPLMALFGVPPVIHEVVAREDAHVDSLALPSVAEVVAHACQGDSIHAGEGLLYGRVLDSAARTVAGVVVTATWQADFALIGMRDGEHLSHSERTLQTRADAGGRWRVCGVPRNETVTLTASSGAESIDQQVRTGDRFMTAVDLVLRPAQRGLAQLEITVADERGSPLSEAVIEVFFTSSGQRTIVTDASGRALLPNVAPGRLTVKARRIGFTPGQVVTIVEEGRVTLPIVMSALRLPMLDTLRVVGARVTRGRLEEFESRRLLRQATVSITREEIEKRNPVDTWQMLTGIASVDVTVRDSRVIATSRRARVSEFRSNTPCYLLVMVDGVSLSKTGDEGGFNLQDLPQPDEIHGIEVFAGPSSIPPQYGGTGAGKWCGLIAIWTR
jgi:hypothetical protein